MMKRMFILQKTIESFLCWPELQFWQPCWNVFARSPENAELFSIKVRNVFTQFTKILKNSVRAQKLLLLNTLPRTLRMSFGNPDEVFLPRCRNFFRSRYGKLLKLFLCKEIFFPSTFLWIPKNPLWRHCWSFFCQKSEIFSLKSRKWRTFLLFFKKRFFLKLFRWTPRLQFWRACQTFLEKVG